MYVDPKQFMSTVSVVHQDKSARKKLSFGKSAVFLADAKIETMIPTFQHVTNSNLADTELNNNLGSIIKYECSVWN